ncbi:MAG TPA: alpha/beta hydrolase [Thermoleophilaceae bacterium]|nr:alpha/beta hydrolase [Thermoleophilaceae bacterium]
MPLLARPDGAEIYWEEAGDGPGVLICNTFNLGPVGDLVERLAPERRVVLYEQRGTGRSSKQGPYDIDTGVADVEALVEETGPVEVAFGIGDGGHRAVRLADARPDLADRVVFTSGTLGGFRGERVAGYAGSTGVLSALMSLVRRDYRSGLRQMMMGSAADSAQERQRVEELAAIVPQEAAVGYLDAWIGADSLDASRRLGERLTVLAYPGNAWFPLESYEELRDHLTGACFELVEDGPMSRPDLAADVLLRVSAPTKG